MGISFGAKRPNEGNTGLVGLGAGLGHSSIVVVVSGTSFTDLL